MLSAWFSRFSNGTAKAAGKPATTAAAVALVVLWAAVGPVFHWSDGWQLVINTGTTIITFLMVFVIQHSQNCDSASLHIKLDEIIRALHQADNAVMDLEKLSPEDLEELAQSYKAHAARARGLSSH
jgi:low affinity Fe/Cu permease